MIANGWSVPLEGYLQHIVQQGPCKDVAERSHPLLLPSPPTLPCLSGSPSDLGPFSRMSGAPPCSLLGLDTSEPTPSLVFSSAVSHLYDCHLPALLHAPP